MKLVGATNTSYSMTNVQADHAGNYLAVVANVTGSLTSSVAALTVITPPGMVLIPAGSFQMGNCMDPAEGDADELPVHTVDVSAFFMDKYVVTKALWDQVYTWAITHGYSFDNAALGKAAKHPVQTMDWYDAVKWCNARSEQEGRTPAYYTSAARTAVYRGGDVDVQNDWVNWNVGYRLPTEAEWEKAARGGMSGQRFPWGDRISWFEANYFGGGSYPYNGSPTGIDPTYDDGFQPSTNPPGSFAANAYGLYDMAGNVWQWCWDWLGPYSNGSQSDPRGPAAGSYRMGRGGCWGAEAFYCRSAYRLNFYPPVSRNYGMGFRTILPPGPQ